MRGRRKLALAVACTILGANAVMGGRVGAAVQPSVAPHATTSAELLKNGNAENGFTGWAVARAPEVVAYGTPGFPSAASPGPADRAKHFFAGGGSGTFSSIQQQVSLAPFANQLKTGNVQVQVSAYLGGYATQNDDAYVAVDIARSSTPDRYIVLVPGTNSEGRSNTTGLLHVQRDLPLPSDATSFRYSVNFEAISGGYDDGYADDVSAKLINIGGWSAPPAVPAGSSPELVKNPHFDAGPGGNGEAHAIPNWFGDFTAVKYGAPLFPAAGGMVPTDHGANFAGGGNTAATPALFVTFPIPVGYKRLVATGKVIVQVSDYDGGYATDPDRVDGLFMTLDASHDLLQYNSLQSGVGPLVRLDRTGLLYRSSSFVLSPLTTYLEPDYSCQNKEGAFCDGYLDDVSVRLLNVPVLPTITKVAPATTPRNKSTAVTITGTNFKSGATLTASGNGIVVTNLKVVSATKVTATVSVSAGATTGKRTLTLVNANQGQVICTNCITVS